MIRPNTTAKALFSGLLLAALMPQAFAQDAPASSTAQNNPPTLGGIPPETIDEGKQFSPIKLDQFVSDPEDKPETMTWSASGNTNLIVNIANRVVTIKTPNADWNGSEAITFTVKDPKGATGAETVTFTVVSINDAPVIKKIADQNIDEGKSFSPIKLDDFITDVDHPANQIQWATSVETVGKDRAPQGGELSVNIDANRVATVVIPDTNWFGAAKVTFTGTDGEGSSVSTSAVFTIRSVNDLPILQTIPDQAIEEGAEFEVINLTSYVSDADHEASTIKWTVAGGNQLKASIDKYNVLSIKIPNKDWNGPVETFLITAKDPANGQSSLNVKFTVKSVNDIPEIKSIPSQTIDEGKVFAPINLQTFVTDIDHRFDQLKWAFTGAKNLRVQQAGANVNITPIDTNWFGDETITFTVTDPENGKAETQTTFTVRSVNDLVSMTQIPDQTIDEGKNFVAIKLDDFVYDGDHKDSELQWEYSAKVTKSSALGELAVNIDANRVAKISIPDSNYNGSAAITFTVSDPEGSKATKTANFIVKSINDLPVAKKIADQTVEEGNEFNSVNLDELVTDSDHEPVQLKWQVSGAQKLIAKIDGNRVFTIMAPDMEYGGPTEELTFTVTDPEGGTATTRAKFTVKPVNDAPIMKEIASQEIKEGMVFKPIDLDAMISDVDNTPQQIKWTFSGNKALKVQMEGRIAKVVAPDTNWNGQETITFTAVDPEGAKIERSANFNIISVNDIPAIKPLADQTIAEGKVFQAIKLDDLVEDSDHKDDQLTWETSVAKAGGAKGTPQLSVQIDAARVARMIIPDTNWFGSEVVTFTVTDPEGGRKAVSATFTVTSVNDIPAITKIPDQTIDEGADFATITLDQFVSDSDHSKEQLKWTLEGGSQLTVSMDKNRNAIVRIPNKEWSGGPETIRFTVTDPEGGTVNTSGKFQVKAINDAPVLKEIPGQSIKEGETFKPVALDQFITDVDNAPNQLKWTLTGNKALKVVMDGQRNVSITAPDTNWWGEESLTFSANDGLTTVERTAAFAVKSVNDLPFLKPINGQTIDEGKKFQSVNLNDLVSDADHKDDEINWSISSAPVGGKKGAVGALSVTIEKGIATIEIPDTNWNGSEVLTFTGTDPEGGKAVGSATYTVNSINDAPALQKIADQSIEEKNTFQSISLGDLISDSDHSKDKLKIAFEGNKDLKIAIDKALVATIVPPNKFWNGSEKVSISVTDPDGAKASQTVAFIVKSVNDLPEISGIKGQSIDEGKEFAPIALDGMVKDDDHAKDQLKWAVTGNKDLKVAIDAARILTIKAPSADWFGVENLTIKATDPAAGSAQSDVTFEIRSVNDAPTFKEVPSQMIDEGKKFTAIKLSDLVSDVDNKKEELVWNATVESVTAAAAKGKAAPVASGPNLIVDIQNGVATIAVPDTNWNGERKITFTVSDPSGAKATASALFTVRSINDLPIVSKEIANKVMSVEEGQGFQALPLASQITDADHAPTLLKWDIAGAKDLKITLDKDKNLTVAAPNPEWSGKELLTLTVTDPEGGKTETKLTYEVKAVNDAPVISKFESQTIKEGESFKPINLDNLLTDSDNKVAEITWTATGAKSIKVEVAKDRTLKIATPDENWAGEPETITLTAKDPAGASATATATFTVTSVNDAPILADIPSQSIQEGQAFKVVNLDEFVSDVDNKKDELTWIAVVSSPAGAAPAKNGAAAVVAPNLSVSIGADRKATVSIPDAEWSGDRTITFTVNDPAGAKISKVVPFNVQSVNDVPVLNKIPDQSVEEGASFTTVDLNGMVSDVDNIKESLIWTIEGNKELKPTITKGILTVAIPDKDWAGSEAFNIQVKDPAGAKAEQKVLFAVKPVNDAPVLGELKGQIIDEGKNFELIDVTKAASDADNKPEELAWTHSEKVLKIEFNKAKQLFRIMAPDSNWFGTDTVTFTVTDPAKALASKQVVFTVKPVNDLPALGKIAELAAKEGEKLKPIDLMKLVSDVDNKTTELKFSIDDSEPAFLDAKGKPGKSKMATVKHQMRFSIDDNGVLNMFTPDADWFGSEIVKVNVFDPSLGKASTDFKVTVAPVNDEPVIVGKIDDATIDEGKSFAPIKLDALVTDVDNKPHELIWSADGNRSLDVVINSGREALVKPKRPDFFGQERITFTVKDPAGAKASVSAIFTVKHVNAAPVLMKIPDQTVNEDETFKSISMDAVASDKDNSKSELRWEVTGNKELVVDMDKAKGTIQIKAPRQDWSGKPEVITFKLRDPEGAEAVTSATYTVLPVNDAPVALGHSYSTKEGEVLSVSKEEGLLQGATDPDGEKPSEAMVVDRPSNGAINAGADGSFSYTPKAGFSGVDEFTFKIRDKQGAQSKVERVEINVQFKMGELRATPAAAPAKPATPDPKKKK